MNKRIFLTPLLMALIAIIEINMFITYYNYYLLISWIILFIVLNFKKLNKLI